MATDLIEAHIFIHRRVPHTKRPGEKSPFNTDSILLFQQVGDFCPESCKALIRSKKLVCADRFVIEEICALHSRK